MYIQNKCTFAPNVHSRRILSIIATLWLCLPNFDYDNCTVAMFAMFDYDCNTVAMFAIYFVWLPDYGNVCHILSMIATICECLLCSKHDYHTVTLFAMFCL